MYCWDQAIKKLTNKIVPGKQRGNEFHPQTHYVVYFII